MTFEDDPQSYDRVLSSMCTPPHPAARAAANRFLASNSGDPATFPAVAALEDRVVERLGQIAGLETPAGYVASGGTEANIQAVRIARNRADVAEPNIVLPESAHFSFRKAAQLLAVEYRASPVDDAGRADVDAMAERIDDRTVLLGAVAGTTEYGRVDPIPAIADLASEQGLHCHVDAAWGGFLLPFTDLPWHFGHAPIDTLSLDPHKFGRAAIPAGGFLARSVDLLDALGVETPYLETTEQVTLGGTRSGAGVASAAAVLEELWPDGYRRQFERTSANAAWLADELADRGYTVTEPSLPLVAAELPDPVFATLREAGWRISRTSAGELRVVCMPHVTRSSLEGFLADLDAV